jgi:hypothetical protein
MIPEVRLKKVLKELNPGFHFDVGGLLDIEHPQMEKRQGVYFHGQHIASMDRGNLPEAKVWYCQPGLVDVPWSDHERYEDASVVYVEIQPTDGEFETAWQMFESKQDGFHVDHNGKLFHYRCLIMDWTPVFVEYVGWQHTLYRIFTLNIPNVTREKVAAGLGLQPSDLKFNNKVAYLYGDE